MKSALSTRNKEKYVMIVVCTHLREVQRWELELDLDPELEVCSVVSGSAQKHGA